MPESPEVQALAEELGARLTGHEIRDVDVVEFRTTKTRARPPATLVGERVHGRDAARQALDLTVGASQHLVVSLGRHGWARCARAPMAGATPPDDAPPALVAIDVRRRQRRSSSRMPGAGCRSDCWVVDDPAEVPAVAKLGPDPADPAFSRADFDRAVVGRRKQVKAVLQEQESLAGHRQRLLRRDPAHARRSRRSCTPRR